MGKLGPMELFIGLVIVLIIFGAKRVPEIGASVGKGIREFKRGMNEIGTADEPAPPARIAEPPRVPASLREEESARPEPKKLL